MAEQHSIDEQRLGLGLTGWLDAAWGETYYPEDLPADWRLGYYANEFNCVQLPQAQWCEADDALWAEWLSSVGDDFRFYLSVDSDLPASLAARVAGRLGPQLGGFLLPDGDSEVLPQSLWPVEVTDCMSHAWQGQDGRLVLQLDLTGLDLRAQRACLEGLAERLASPLPHALLLTGEGVGPAQAAQFRLLAEMMGVA